MLEKLEQLTFSLFLRFLDVSVADLLGEALGGGRKTGAEESRDIRATSITGVEDSSSVEVAGGKLNGAGGFDL